MESSLASIPTMADTATSERGSLARELEELRESIRNQHEHSAVLGTDHVDCDHAAVHEFGAPSGIGEDEREEESNGDDDDCDEDDDGSRGEESGGSAEWLRDDLINFAKPGSAAGAASHSAVGTPPAAPGSPAPPGFGPAAAPDLGRVAPQNSGARHAPEKKYGVEAEDNSTVFVPSPVAGTPTKSAAADPCYQDADNCCVKCELTGTAEHANHCNASNGRGKARCPNGV